MREGAAGIKLVVPSPFAPPFLNQTRSPVGRAERRDIQMLIVADENIPQVEVFFGRLGEVRLVPGRMMTPASVRDADMLLVRSVTPVGESLLAGSRARFVGSATIGADHIDRPWLAARGIAFASAPGSNAESVAQYVAAALAWSARRLGITLRGASIGVVGVGQCGSRVARIARALGMEVVLNDPPLARATGRSDYRPLDELMDCDFVTLHAPLTREGDDPTWRLFDARRLGRLKDGAVLFNTSRGFIVDEPSLLERLAAGRLGGAVIDAWENEPRINPALLDRAVLGTPHIAGYSTDGKLNGTRMIHESARAHLGLEPEPIDPPLPPPAARVINRDARGRSLESVESDLILAAYPIERDDADLRRAAETHNNAIGPAFDQLRKDYPIRREFAATEVRLTGAPADWAEPIRRLGFGSVMIQGD